MKAGKLFLILLLPLHLCAQYGSEKNRIINISGQWNFQMNAAGKGADEKWFTHLLNDKINLPGSILTTDWFGAGLPQEDKENNIWNKKKLLPAPYREFHPLKETTIAVTFKANGYATFIAGKWHLGEPPQDWPGHQGFDVNKGGNLKGHPGSYFSPYSYPRLTGRPPGKYLGDRLAKEAITFLEDNKNNSFFLYFPFYEVHTSLELVLQGDDLNLYMAKKNHIDELGHKVIAIEIIKLFGNQKFSDK